MLVAAGKEILPEGLEEIVIVTCSNEFQIMITEFIEIYCGIERGVKAIMVRMDFWCHKAVAVKIVLQRYQQ